MENPDISKRNGYRPINTNPEDELKLNTDSEMPTGENKNNYVETENLPVRRSNRKCMQPSRYGGVRYTKNFWVWKEKHMFVSGPNRSSLIPGKRDEPDAWIIENVEEKPRKGECYTV